MGSPGLPDPEEITSLKMRYPFDDKMALRRAPAKVQKHALWDFDPAIWAGVVQADFSRKLVASFYSRLL